MNRVQLSYGPPLRACESRTYEAKSLGAHEVTKFVLLSVFSLEVFVAVLTICSKGV